MKFTETPLKGAFVVELEPREDFRGFFARAYCEQEFAQHGLPDRFVQGNMSYNHKKGTVRGLHYQVPPALEAKFMRCIGGAIFDVIVDMRPGSPTYLQWFGLELSAANRKALYVPPLFAHAYQALTDGAEVFYLVSQFYTPGTERGLRPDDPALDIKWPLPIEVISEKDMSWPLLER